MRGELEGVGVGYATTNVGNGGSVTALNRDGSSIPRQILGVGCDDDIDVCCRRMKKRRHAQKEKEHSSGPKACAGPTNTCQCHPHRAGTSGSMLDRTFFQHEEYQCCAGTIHMFINFFLLLLPGVWSQ